MALIESPPPCGVEPASSGWLKLFESEGTKAPDPLTKVVASCYSGHPIQNKVLQTCLTISVDILGAEPETRSLCPRLRASSTESMGKNSEKCETKTNRRSRRREFL